MTLIVEKSKKTVRKIKIVIGDEWTEVNFGWDMPREEAWKRALIVLESFK